MITLENVNKIYSNNLHAVKDVNLKVNEGDIFGIIGLSGAGKSSLIRLINRLEEPTSGKILINGEDILSLNKTQLLERRKKIGMIFQDPLSALNPLQRIGQQIEEGLIYHTNLNTEERKQRAFELLKRVGIEKPERIYKQFPHQLSGGMRQRVVIAIALSCKPKILIADEPTTAIDSLNQKDIIDEFIILKKELNVSLLFVTHDLGVLTNLADNLIVMQNGEIVEKGTTKEIMTNAKHEHTKFLIGTRRALMEKFKKVKEYDK